MKLYHISTSDLGKKITLHPRTLSMEDFMEEELGWENDSPTRICVAPSIAQCLLAMPDHNLDGRRKLWVYSTRSDNPKQGREWDTAVTEEKWLLEKHTFQWEKTLPSAVSLFIKMWVHNDKYGYEPYLPRKDRLELIRIKLKGIRIFLRNLKNDQTKTVDRSAPYASLGS